jgi:hypothetical protein
MSFILDTILYLQYFHFFHIPQFFYLTIGALRNNFNFELTQVSIFENYAGRIK